MTDYNEKQEKKNTKNNNYNLNHHPHREHKLTLKILVYVTDFIIMAGALFWYNRFHISDELSRKKKIIAK